MLRVSKDGEKATPQLSVVRGEHVPQPVERLDEAHGGPARPVKAAGRCMAKVDDEFPETDRAEACIGQYGDARRDSVGQSEVIGRRDAVHEDSNAILAGERVDYGAGVGRGGFSGKAIGAWNIVETTSDAAQFPGSDQTVHGLVHGSAGSEVGEVIRGPDVDRPSSGNTTADSGGDAG